MKVPVLFIVFNRPDTTVRVWEAIRAARPERLYIAADGPRHVGEATRCLAVRRLLKRVDWPCEVRRLYRETNLGCRFGPSTALNWFFEHEVAGIVLEDDCLPSPSFFRFCAELLERFKDDNRVLTITGDNFQKDMNGYPYSYYFSRYFHGWGWASWARAWKINDDSMSGDVDFDAISTVPGFAQYWQNEFDMVRGPRKLQAWDHVWMLSCWKNGGVSVVPKVNMVCNMGFGPEATHCRNPNWPTANLPRSDIEFPLVHPEAIQVHQEADDFTSRHVFNVGRCVPAL